MAEGKDQNGTICSFNESSFIMQLKTDHYPAQSAKRRVTGPGHEEWWRWWGGRLRPEAGVWPESVTGLNPDFTIYRACDLASHIILSQFVSSSVK